MNKYQREKAKRMKKLSNLGISYYCQKRIMRNYNSDQVDVIIEQVTKFKNSGLFEKIQNMVKGTRRSLMQLIRAYRKKVV